MSPENCPICKAPLRDWKEGEPIPPQTRVDEAGKPLDQVRVCDKCGARQIGLEIKPEEAKGFECAKCKERFCFKYACGCGSFCYNCAPCHLDGIICHICKKEVEWDHIDGGCDEAGEGVR